MGYDIDTGEIRRIARQIKAIAGSVGELSAADIPAIQQGLEGSFEGEAAKALEEALLTLRSDVGRLSGGLNGIQQELMAYAARIDAADEAAARAIAQK